VLENAVRHSVTVGAIEMSSWTEADQACLSVRNDGPPVDARDIERLFEPSVRGQHDGDMFGTGLGLRSSELSHGGTVKAAPQRRGGLELTIRLPRSEARATGCEPGARMSSSLPLHRGRVAALNSLEDPSGPRDRH
jgi:signal transduction histidine kinase